MKAYCLTGIGANEEVFHNLNLEFDYVPIVWSPTSNKESLKDYAKNLCVQVDTSEKFILIGVSYGGMLATEMNKFITPEKTILISSVANRKELPSILKFLGKTGIINIIPAFLFTVPPFLLFWLFGVNHDEGKKMIRKIVGGIDKGFTKMSIKKILNWDNQDIPENLIRIHGDSDRLLPVPKGIDYIKVKNGRHFMIGDRSEEVSKLLNDEFKKLL
jgi:hypothetical protein